MPAVWANTTPRVVVLVSGSGSNLQAMIDAKRRDELPIDLRAVISNRADAFALARAQTAGIAAEILTPRGYAHRDTYDRALAARLDAHGAELIVLAGFLRILGAELVERYRGRLINIHPSLLPAFRGLHTHRRALAAGVREHGCSVHYVTPALDAGPVIVQAAVPVRSTDTEASLADAVQAAEHRVYPLALRWLAEGRVALEGERVRIDGRVREHPPRLTPDQAPESLLPHG